MVDADGSRWTRRRLMQGAGAAAAAGFGALGSPTIDAAQRPVDISPARRFAQATSLPDAMTVLCSRLADSGWRALLLRVTDDELDIGVADLPAMLGAQLTTIDRTVPGFEDFSLEGVRAIEPGNPSRSLLYHAFASPNVFEDGSGSPLADFPTPAEIELVENYVYGVTPPSLDELRERAQGRPVAVVVFALEYRPGRETVRRRHADLCFSRTGMARAGTAPAHYNAQRREFLPVVADDPFAFRVMPARYAAYIAYQSAADPERFGPLRATSDDAHRQFWVPLHKLFDGPECIAGMNLTVDLIASHQTEKLRRLHHHLNEAGFYTGWDAPDIEQFPFVITGDTLAAFSKDASHGTGWVLPAPHPLVEAATRNSEPLTIFYSSALASIPDGIFFSGLQILVSPPFDPLGPARTQALPENLSGADQDFPGYLTEIAPDTARSVPEYLNVRHRVNSDGAVDNLNDDPELMEIISDGGYWVRHFVDYTADGWVSARCAALDTDIPLRVHAYSLVSPPSFYPYTNQRELTEWAETEVPEELREGIWAIPPRPLSDRRLAANIYLPAGFDIHDDTVTAIVSQPVDPNAAQTTVPATFVRRHRQLPDGAAGLFDPGWDVSQDRTEDNFFFLGNHGLGTPFIEDAKLCATLSTYWPGVSPDTSREFQPEKTPSNANPNWPVIAPMTDEEIGSAEVPGGGFFPWDGIMGPVIVTIDGTDYADYPDLIHTDYLETYERFTASLTAAVDHDEYTARVLAMAQVYWSLGIRFAPFRERYDIGEALDRFQMAKAQWAVLSFRAVSEGDDELGTAEAATGVQLAGPRRYRFHLYKWGAEHPHPGDPRRLLVEIGQQLIIHADHGNVLIGRDDGTWEQVVPPVA